MANFNELFYLANNPDVAIAVSKGDIGSGWAHFEAFGEDEGRSFAEPDDYGDFNEEFYLARHPDVAVAVSNGDIGSGWKHFQDFGKAEGRSFAEPIGYGDFSEEFYLAQNPDVAVAVNNGGRSAPAGSTLSCLARTKAEVSRSLLAMVTLVKRAI